MKTINLKKLVIVGIIAIISGLIWFYFLQFRTNEAKLEADIRVKQSQIQLKTTEIQKLNGSTLELQKQAEQLLKDKEQLTKDLQAKRAEQERIASLQIPVTQTARAEVIAVALPSGSHTDWMAQAGIPEDQWGATERLVQRESSWNPNAYNSIGACSLVQALPCSKIPGDWHNPVDALKWGNGYVVARYGTWNAALAHSYAVNWY